MNALAAEMKSRRAELRISQEELAHRAGLGATFVARLETAQNQPSLTAFVQLAQAVGVRPSSLLAAVMRRHAKELSANT